MEVLEQKPSDPDSEKKVKLIDAVLHTSEQRTTSEKHVELLKQRGGNAVLFPCSDISSLESTNMADLSSLHLIVDTCLYRILMEDGYLCDVVRRKFKELDKSGKRIHVFNTLPLEFEELFLQIPRNARTRWDEENPTGVYGEDTAHKQTDGNLPKLETLSLRDFQVKGPSGGTMDKAYVAGAIDGGMGNINNESSMVVHTARNYQIINQGIGDEGTPSITVEEGSQTSSHNWLKITINTNQQDKKILKRLTNEKESLKSEDIHEVEIHRGSVIIKLYVDKSRIMADKWIHEILQKIFHDILKDFFTEETVQVMCERHISMGVEHFLEMYSSHHSYDECHVKVKKPFDIDQLSTCTAESGIACMDDLRDLDYSNTVESMTKTSLQSFEGSKFNVTGYDVAECQKCKTIIRNTDELPFPESRYLVTHMEASIINRSIDGPSKDLREARLRYRWRLRCLVSAVRNSGGGVVLVHICGLKQFDRCLDGFREIVINALKDMLEKGSLFVNTFRVKWVEEIDQTPNDLLSHVVSVCAQPSESVSTAKFNTTVSNDLEVLHITHEQIRRYLKTRDIFTSTKPHIRGLLKSKDSGNVRLKALVLDDNIFEDPCCLAKYIWKRLKLNWYISAFSKIEGGGSFYVGVSKRRMTYSTYHKTQVDMNGFLYRTQQQDELKAALRRQIKEDTLVLFFDSEAPPAPLPPEYVEIVFHEVSAGRVVLEVAIAAVNGLVFDTKEGPEAYELGEDDKLQRLDVQEWKRRLLME